MARPQLRLGIRSLNLATSYTGFMYDPVLGIYFAQARMYDPTIRRFMAVDPIRGNIFNIQSMIPYTYVLNNPLRWVDPLGLSPNEVGLSDFARAAGADVGWNEDTRYASVTMGGVTKNFHVDNFNNVDGRIQIDPRELDWLFEFMDWGSSDCCCDHSFLEDAIFGGGNPVTNIVAMQVLHKQLGSVNAVKQMAIAYQAQANINKMAKWNLADNSVSAPSVVVPIAKSPTGSTQPSTSTTTTESSSSRGGLWGFLSNVGNAVVDLGRGVVSGVTEVVTTTAQFVYNAITDE